MNMMRRWFGMLCALLLLSSCAANRHNTNNNGNGGLLNPDEVFTVTDDDIARETWEVNKTICGDWTYKGPSVDVSGKNLLAGIGKPVAKGKLKKKLKTAYKKIGLDKARPHFVFNPDGTCAVSILGASMKGKYNYNPSTKSITLKWHGIPMNARLLRDGKNKMHITFDADKLLSLIKFLGKFSDSSAIKALSFLMDHYDDVMVGFELKK